MVASCCLKKTFGGGRRFSWICIFMAGRLKQPFPGAVRAGAAGVEPGAHVEVGQEESGM